MNFPQKNTIRFAAAAMLLFLPFSLFSAETSNTSYSNFYTNNNQSLNINSDLPIIKSTRDPNFKLQPDYKKYRKYQFVSNFYRGVSIIPWVLYGTWICFDLRDNLESNERWLLDITCYSIIPITPTIFYIHYNVKKAKYLSHIITNKNYYKNKYYKRLIVTQSISSTLWIGSTIVMMAGRYRIYSPTTGTTSGKYNNNNAIISAIGYIAAFNLNLIGIRLAFSARHMTDRKPVGDVFLGGSKKGIIAGYRMSF